MLRTMVSEEDRSGSVPSYSRLLSLERYRSSYPYKLSLLSKIG